MNYKVSFIGSGNVATNLAKALHKKGVRINNIYSNTLKNAQALAQKVNALSYSNNINQIDFNNETVIIALKDDIIEQVLKQVKSIKNCLLLHTSGSFDTEKLKQFSKNYGCLYPFQTFKKEIEVNFSEIHLFIEANNIQQTQKVWNIASLLTQKVVKMTTEERKALHIAGVGLNNFTHFLLSITKQYCEDNNLKTEYLTNLLTQTVNNSFYLENALNNQTGPARRGDINIINEHLDKLKNAPKYRKIYKTMSQLILDEFHNEKYKL